MAGSSAWLLAPGVLFTAADGRVGAALDAVFGAFRSSQGLGHPVCLSAVADGERGWAVAADGAVFGHCSEEGMLAPLLESVLSDHVVALRGDCVVLHAATLVFGEQVVVFPGDRRSGKSSLSFSLCGQGVDYGGDDLCFFRAEDFFIEPFPKAVTLKEGSFFMAPEAAEFPDPLRGRVRLPLPVHHTLEELALSRVAAVVFPQFASEGEAGCDRVEPELAAMALVQQLCGGVGRHERSLELVQALCRKPVWRMRYGGSEAARVLLEREVLV